LLFAHLLQLQLQLAHRRRFVLQHPATPTATPEALSSPAQAAKCMVPMVQLVCLYQLVRNEDDVFGWSTLEKGLTKTQSRKKRTFTAATRSVSICLRHRASLSSAPSASRTPSRSFCSVRSCRSFCASRSARVSFSFAAVTSARLWIATCRAASSLACCDCLLWVTRTYSHAGGGCGGGASTPKVNSQRQDRTATDV
jgi:hypothetical protein